MRRFEDVATEAMIEASNNVLAHLRRNPNIKFRLIELNGVAALNICGEIRKRDFTDEQADEDKTNAFPLSVWLEDISCCHRTIVIIHPTTTEGLPNEETTLMYNPFRPKSIKELYDRLRSPMPGADVERGSSVEFRQHHDASSCIALSSKDFHGEDVKKNAVDWNNWLNQLHECGQLMYPLEAAWSSGSAVTQASPVERDATTNDEMNSASSKGASLHSFLLANGIAIVSMRESKDGVLRWLPGSFPQTLPHGADWTLQLSSLRQGGTAESAKKESDQSTTEKESDQSTITVTFEQVSKDSKQLIDFAPAKVRLVCGSAVNVRMRRKDNSSCEADTKVRITIVVNEKDKQDNQQHVANRNVKFPIDVMVLRKEKKPPVQTISLLGAESVTFFAGHRQPPCGRLVTALGGDDDDDDTSSANVKPAEEMNQRFLSELQRRSSWFNLRSEELQSASAFASVDKSMIAIAKQRVFEPIDLRASHSRLATAVLQQQRQKAADDAKKAAVDAPVERKRRQFNAARFELRNTHMLRYGIDFRHPPRATEDHAAQNMKLR